MAYGRDHYKSNAQGTGSINHVVYVRKEGKDTNNGTINKPLSSISAALRRIPFESETNIIIDIGNGIWEENITIPRINFFGGKEFSRSLTTKLGLAGTYSNYLGFVIRGAADNVLPFKKNWGLKINTLKEGFFPKPVKAVTESPQNYLFSPATKIIGSVVLTPGSCVELSCLSISSGEERFSFPVHSYGGMLTLKGVILESSSYGSVFDSFSDTKMSGCIVEAEKPIQVRGRSILRVNNTLFSVNSGKS